MKLVSGLRLGTLAVLITAASVVAWPAPASAETRGMERRDDRGENREIKQDGREEGREVQEECKDSGGNRIECRQEKRDTRQDARDEGRDEKYDGQD